MIKISVIIPIYNTEEYLEECLQSVVNQTLKEIEIICVDDGSTDKSFEILKQYEKKDLRVKIFQNPTKDAGNARNYGLKQAHGDYVIFFDSDDYMKLNTLEKLYNNSVEKNADITVCKSINLENKTKKFSSIEHCIRDKEYSVDKVFCPKDKKYCDNIFQFFVAWPWDKLYKRDFLISNNLTFQNLRHSNDTSFVLSSLACAERISVLQEELIIHRIYSQSISATREEAPECFYIALCRLKEELEKRDLYEKYQKSYEKYCKNFGRWHISSVKNNPAKKIMIEYYKKILNIPQEQKIAEEYDLEDLVKISSDKKIMFWGASLFLEDILTEAKSLSTSILGIIDKDSSKWGKNITGYEIFSPEILKEKNVEAVIFTIQNNNEIIYSKVKKEIEENYSNVELLPNIFEDNACF